MITTQRALVRMPEVVGLPLKKARLLVENAGLAMGEVVFMESYDARDTVLTQKPQRGQMVYAGEKVTVGISRESWVKWLPSVYQRADVNGRNVVREVLWIIQHLFASIEEKLDVIHTFFDPYEAPAEFLPWLASWSAMVLDEDWPVAKKRRLIKKAIELYRLRGTVKGLTLFISLFTGHEPRIRENEWPFRGWRIGATSEVGVDTVVLPPVNLAHAFIVEMPVAYKDLSPEAVIRIHEIISMEKPAHTQYYLRFATEGKKDELRQLMTIGTRSGIGLGVSEEDVITDEAELKRMLEEQASSERPEAKVRARSGESEAADDPFSPAQRTRPPLPKAPRADTAPVEGREVRSDEAGGFGRSARQMEAVNITITTEAVKTGKTVMGEARAEQPSQASRGARSDSEKVEMPKLDKKDEKKPEAKKPDEKDPKKK